MTRWWWRLQDWVDPFGAPERYRERWRRQVAAFERIIAVYQASLMDSQRAIEAFRVTLTRTVTRTDPVDRRG